MVSGGRSSEAACRRRWRARRRPFSPQAVLVGRRLTGKRAAAILQVDRRRPQFGRWQPTCWGGRSWLARWKSTCWGRRGQLARCQPPSPHGQLAGWHPPCWGGRSQWQPPCRGGGGELGRWQPACRWGHSQFARWQPPCRWGRCHFGGWQPAYRGKPPEQPTAPPASGLPSCELAAGGMTGAAA